MQDRFQSLKEKILAFRKARDWEQFHDPKNLAEAVSIEAGELLANFLWKDVPGGRKLSDAELANAREEAADIRSYNYPQPQTPPPERGEGVQGRNKIRPFFL